MENPSTTMEDELELKFIERAEAVLNNATIGIGVHIRAELDASGVVGANPDEVIYQIDL